MPSIEERLDKLERTLYGITPTGPSYALQSVRHKGRLLQTQRDLDVLAPLTAQEDSARQRIALGFSPLWVDWTPTVTQGASVSVTVTEAKYCLLDKVCVIYASLVVTGAGTNANVIKVAGLPVVAQPAAYGRLPTGVGYCLDNGVAEYVTIVIPNAANDIWFSDSKTQAWLGTNPAFALAANDTLNFSAVYRVA